jgi:hypothetical protein
MNPLVTVGPGSELESGLFPSVDALSAPFWEDGENIEFRKGGVTSSLGYTNLSTLPGEVSTLEQAFVSPNDQRIYAAVARDVYMRSSVSGLSALGSFPSTGSPYFETFGSWLLGTNYVDPIMLWKNTGVLEEIPDVPFTFAKILHRKDNHVLALNTSNGQASYAWCSASDVEDWIPTTANSAGENFIRDLDSEILCVADLGDQVAVYSRETMAVINFIGTPYVFGHKFALNGIGAVGGHSIVSVGARNIGINRQGVFTTDGLDFRFVSEPAVFDWIVENINFDLGELIVGYHNEQLESVIWYFEKIGGGRAGLGYNYRNNRFNRYSFPILAAMERSVFTKPIAAIGAALVQLNDGHSAAGTPFTKWIRTKPISAQDATIYKIWSHLKTVGQWTNSKVRIGVLTDPNDSNITWISLQDMAYENWFDYESVFIVLEFRAELLDAFFAFSQLQLGGTRGGKVSG